jgi:hypothetical protein
LDPAPTAVVGIAICGVAATVAALVIGRTAAAIAAAALCVSIAAIRTAAAFLIFGAANGDLLALVALLILHDAEVSRIVPIALSADEPAVPAVAPGAPARAGPIRPARVTGSRRGQCIVVLTSAGFVVTSGLRLPVPLAAWLAEGALDQSAERQSGKERSDGANDIAPRSGLGGFRLQSGAVEPASV